MKRDYNYIRIDEILEKDFYEYNYSLKFEINSQNEREIEDILQDFGLHQTNTILNINDFDFNEVSEIEKFYRIFKSENDYILYEVNIDYNSGNTSFCIKLNERFEELNLLYAFLFKQGMMLTKHQVKEFFGEENDPLYIIKMAFQILGYKYVDSSSFDDFGIMTLNFIKNGSKFHLIGPLIEFEKEIDNYFDLECNDKFMEEYSLRMDDTFINGFNSFSSLLSNIHNPNELKSLLFTHSEYLDLIEKHKL